jgi:transcriptional regulator with XRE-family HTH domain
MDPNPCMKLTSRSVTPHWAGFIQSRAAAVQEAPPDKAVQHVAAPLVTPGRLNGGLSGGSGHLGHPQPQASRFWRRIMLPQRDTDPVIVFHNRFAALVDASGLSIRDIARQARVGRSTIDGWKHGKALPQNRDDLIKVVNTLKAAVSAGNGDTRETTQGWASLLGQAKEARDARSYPARRPPSGPARDAVIDSERRARTIAATGRAMEALSGLLNLGGKPDWGNERRSWTGKEPAELDAVDQAAVDEWERQRDELLRGVRMAVLDIGDAELRSRLEESFQILERWAGPMHYARQSEARTRYLAATETLEAIGAFRRGDPLPERSADYLSTKDFVGLYLEELELNSTH